ncbi:hypothetical protein NQ011_03000 [Corynebacterium phoceense]|uniref:hypothetical protein n=1 Tax=Corynebacterium phoceense TaxID=1686286 RepID=UPI00211CDFD8|nr:hypothetical protein [Corynebacterium phoceense]MCQ9335669.1 hypothetical protein [Corynebacterium phoceense]
MGAHPVLTICATLACVAIISARCILELTNPLWAVLMVVMAFGAVMLRGEARTHGAEQNETGLDNDLRSSAVCPADSATNA